MFEGMGGAGGASGGGMMAMLQKLLSGGANVEGLAGQAAMKAPPPPIGPGPGGVIAPGAFAGVMDPTVGAVPQGVQSPIINPMPRAPIAPVATPGTNQALLNAQQAGVLARMGEQAPLHYPGASLGSRPGQISINQAGGGAGGAGAQYGPHKTLGQLIG